MASIQLLFAADGKASETGAYKEPFVTKHDELVQLIWDQLSPLKVVKQPLTDCVGLVLAEDRSATFDLPRVACSGVDGYALKSADVVSASRQQPVTLAVIDSIRAGMLPRKEVLSGTAARIMTGAMLPKGADCVVRFEDTDEPGNTNGPQLKRPESAGIFVAAAPWDNIRRPGSYSKNGALIVPQGTVIGPAQLAALSAHGITVLKVVRRPVIAILSTGDELVRAGKPLGSGKSYDCNATALAALVSRYGCIPKVLGIARDNMDSVLSKLRRGLATDALITSGGASRGDYDLIRLVLEKMGRVVCSTTMMGGGGSFTFGLLNSGFKPGAAPDIPVFALPGSPSGCLINFEMLVKPALFKLLGYRSYERTQVEAEALDSLAGSRRQAVLKWSLLQKGEGTAKVRLHNPDEHGMFASIAAANSLTLLPKQTDINTGDTMQVVPLNWCSN